MNISQVTDGIYHLSVNAYDMLFESLWPIDKEGVSMNSYIVKGEKTAIVDGVCGWDGVPETLYKQFEAMNLNPEDIDYIIINHMEPDHSGWLLSFKKYINDSFTLVTHEKSIPLLERFYGITHGKIMTVGDGSTLDLGDGRVLAFAEIPNVHWPETIATFDTKSGTIMPCDAFGSFGAMENGILYDDQMDDEKLSFYERQATRYYSNIVGAFSSAAKKAIEKAGGLPIKIIAPGHGVVWRKNPKKIIDDYLRYTSYSQGPSKKQVTILWASMYGNTEKLIQPIEETLKNEGVKVAIQRLPDTKNLSYVIRDVWESSGVIVACPTYEYKLFPAIAFALEELGNKKALNRKVFYCGSYGWSEGLAEKEMKEIIERRKMNWDILESVTFKGSPTSSDIEAVRQRSKELARAVRAWVE